LCACVCVRVCVYVCACVNGGQEVLVWGGKEHMHLLSFHLSLNSVAAMSMFLSVVCVCKCNLTYPGGEPALQVDLCGV
jgi:hypothetical protein